LEPDSDQNKLVCRLEYFSIDKHPSYLALSYVWGDDKVTTRLKCDDCYLHITRNLEAALFNLRLTRKHRWVWVDAICICQNDPDEKAAQIQLMRHIYAQSMQTIVWLGGAGDDGFLATALIQTLYFHIMQHPEWKGRLLEDNLNNLGIGSISRPLFWQALRRFYDRPYFNRVWVMQEVAVSKKLMVVFGSMTLEYSHLEKVTNVIPAQFEFEGSLPSAIFSLRTVYQKLRNENCALPLSYLIFSDAKLQATMAVDKVYAWLGLSDEAQNPVFQPDYRSDERSVFLHIGKNLLLRHMEEPSIGILSPLWLLYGAGIREGEKSKLPTWLSIPPDPNASRIVEQQLMSRKQRFSVCGFSGSRIRFTDDSEVLYVRGRKLDCIKSLGPKMGDDVQARGVNSPWAVLERERFAFIQKHTAAQAPASQSPLHDSFNGQDLACPLRPGESTSKGDPHRLPWEEVYWRTVILNTDNSGSIAGPEFGKYLNDWHEEVRHQEWQKSHPEPEHCHFDHSFKQGSFAWSLAANEADSYRRRIFVTERGYIGLGKPLEEVGDVICLLYGSGAPAILRPQGNHYLLVGDCYVHEIMNGEALEWPGLEDTEFEIH